MIAIDWFKRMPLLLGSLLIIFTVIKAQQIVSETDFKFNTAPLYQLGLNAADRAYVDLDGDGFLDVAVVNGGQQNPNPTITILFGKGNGDFNTPLVFPSYLIGQAIAIGDLNGDGRPDIVAASFYQNALEVFLNQGNRQFSAPVFSIPASTYGQFFQLAVADFDGDGKNDVVALEGQVNQQLRFFHFNTNGTLNIFVTLNQLETDTSYERIMRIGDINGDNRPDIVFAGGGPFGVRNISFVFGQPPGGTLSITWGFGVEDKTVGVSVVDLDNDGDNDLAVAFLDTTTPTRHSLQVFRNIGNGNFSAMPKIFLEYPFPPDDITSADFNNDGIPDLAALVGSVSNSGVMVAIEYGRGNCVFVQGNYYAVASSTSIFATDINQDNRPDILTASNFGLQSDYSAYEGVSTSTLGELFNDNSQGFRGPLVKLWGTNFIDAGDFNNDGFLDMASSWATSFNNLSGADISINDKRGGFYEEVSYTSPAALSDMKVGDFNGDGNADALTAHAYNSRVLAVYLGDGRGTLNTPVTTSFGQPLNKMIVGDFNRDGKDDVFVVDSTGKGYSMLSVGDGTFSAARDSPVTLLDANPSLEKGDFNRDKYLDLVITSGGSTKLWIGDGTGKFVQSNASIPTLGNAVAGDFNGDGNLDLAGSTAPVGTLPPWRTDIAITGVLGNGKGGFVRNFSRNIQNFSNFRSTQCIVSADFDLDGFDDLAIIQPENTFGNLILLRSGGNTPSWDEPVFLAAGTATVSLVAADFNTDGKPDLEWLGHNSRGVIYNMAPQRRIFTPFDFDGDGKTDVSVFRPSLGQWWVYRSSDGGNLAVQFGASSDVISPGDFTGDGKTDMAFFRPSTGQWFILRSEDFSFYGFQFGTNGDIPTPADFDGDGKTDVAVFRPSSAAWYVFRSSDSGVTALNFGLPTDKPAAADYDGDGKADVAVWRPNGATGGEWWILKSSNGSVYGASFGTSTDKAVPGDYTGDGKADIAFWRPSNGFWYVLRSEDASFYGFPFGTNGDVPAPGDYDGDGKFDAAVFRQPGAQWFVNKSSGGVLSLAFGIAGDQAIPNAYVR